jgi:hypothetical protein
LERFAIQRFVVRTARMRFFCGAVCTTFVLAFPAGAGASPIAGGAPEQSAAWSSATYAGHGAEYWHWEYVMAERRAHRLERARRWRPTSHYAMRLAAAAFGVPFADLRAVAMCETGGTLSPFERNTGSGASGLFQFLASTWRRTTFARFSRFDPVASSLAAAQIVADEGWRQWTCGYAAR